MKHISKYIAMGQQMFDHIILDIQTKYVAASVVTDRYTNGHTEQLPYCTAHVLKVNYM